MKTFEARISARGQVRIPPAVRAALDLKPGDSLVFDQDESGRVHLRSGARSTISDEGGADLSRLQDIARAARRASIETMSADPVGDYLVADDERTKSHR